MRWFLKKTESILFFFFFLRRKEVAQFFSLALRRTVTTITKTDKLFPHMDWLPGRVLLLTRVSSSKIEPLKDELSKNQVEKRLKGMGIH